MKKERSVVGKPLFPTRESAFENRWKHTKNVKTHDGIEISKSGHLMGKTFQERKAQLKYLANKIAK